MRQLTFLLLAFSLAPAARAQNCSPARTALVLSGGGAKGLAHIGVLRVLDSLGVRPDLVVGTSIGAMVGGMYASGYSAREIDSLARALPIRGLFRTYQPRAPRSLGLLQPLIVLEQGTGHFILQTASIREPEVNALVNAAMLRGNLLARGDFDALPIPFRAVATDLTNRQPVVIATGDLAQAVRASFSIPLIFSPESLDGRLLADGGLSANIPIAVARQAGAERVIVADATEQLSDSLDLYSPFVQADRLLGFLFQQPGDSLQEGDLLVRPMVDGFTSFNFSPARVDQLIRNGIAAAETTLSRATCLRTAPAGKMPAPPSRITGLTIASTSSSERLAIQRLLGLQPGDTLDVTLLRSRLQHLGQSDAFRSVWLSPRGVNDSVSFHVTVQRSARRLIGLGLAYDNELGGRMWAGVVEQRLFDLALEGSAGLFLGDFRQDLLLGLRRNYQLGRQLMTPTLTARFALEQVRRFDSEGDELGSGYTREVVGFLGLERVFHPGWELAAGLMGHAWHEPGSDRSAVGIEVRGLKATPARLPVLQAGLSWNGVYQRAAMELTGFLRHGPLQLLPRLRLGWGDGLPLQSEFALGGEDGFPGLHLGERRGDREALLGFMLTYDLTGPFVARAELVTGRAAHGGSLVQSAGWLTGVRAGLGAHTPVGPVRVEYGVASTGRGAVFVRLGRWF
ncbi:MAG TPA: patatin-like phospholipase family protein [Gemmatimonadales bacterium]|nr:patatin-like phospholipase family protein [Gemmatimonadales bacterium]